MSPNPQFPAVLVTFTEEIYNGKFHFLCSVYGLTSFLWLFFSMDLAQKQPSRGVFI